MFLGGMKPVEYDEKGFRPLRWKCIVQCTLCTVN